MAKGVAINVIHGDKKSQNVYTLDEAIEETKYGKFQMILIISTGLALMGASLENVNVSVVMPYVKCDLNLTTTEQGILGSISFLGIMSTSYGWGFLADTWGRQKVIRIAVFGGFIFSLISAFSINVLTLIICRFLGGASLAGVNAGAFSYVSEFHTMKRAGIATALVTVFVCLIWICIPFLAILTIPMDWVISISILEFKPWRLFLMCNAFVNCWNGIVFSFMPETPKFLLVKDRKEEALQVLSKMYAINTGETKMDYPVKEIAFTSLTHNNNMNPGKGFCNIFQMIWKQTKPIFQEPYLANTWKLCFIIIVIFSIGHGTFMWFTDFITQVRNNVGPQKTLCEIVGGKIDTETVSNLCNINNKDITVFNMLLLIGLVFTFLSLLTIFGLKHIAPKILVCGWMAISMVAGLFLNFLEGFYPIFVDFVIFLSCVLVTTVVMAVAINLYPTQYRATATSFIFMCGRLGGVLGSNLVGILLVGHCEMIFYTFSVILFTSSLVFLLVRTETKETPTSKTDPQ